MTHGAVTLEKVSRSPRGKNTHVPCAGERFGRWRVEGAVEYRQTKDRARPYVLCLCDCGVQGWVNVRNLRAGNSTSCGCFHREQASIANATHGQTGQRLYRIWKQMHQRCENPRSRAYRWYGAKGITVCEAWGDFETFQGWALAKGYFDGAEIDRDNSSKGYCPDNCWWVTKQDNLITRKNLLPVHLERQLQSMARELGVSSVTLIRRAVAAYVPDAKA